MIIAVAYELHVQLLFGLPVHDGVRVHPARLEQLDKLQDAGSLLVKRRIPQPPLHMPGQVEFPCCLGKQVVRHAGLVWAGSRQGTATLRW
jgi:hypothetical protein